MSINIIQVNKMKDKKNNNNNNNPLEIIISELISDKNNDELTNVLYFCNKNINKIEFLQFISNCIKSKSNDKISKYINKLNTDSEEYDYFLVNLNKKLLKELEEQIGYNIGSYFIESLDKDVFWTVYVIATKKCLGTDNFSTSYTKTEYFNSIHETLNADQISTHNYCLDIFNLGIQNSTIKNTPYLKVFLHNLHIYNKSKKIRKKNIQRIRKRAQKIVQLSKFAKNSQCKTIFDNGNHKVSKQFSDAIIKLYFLK